MKATRIFETVLYASNIPATQRFYADVLGLDVLNASDTSLVFRLPAGVLLIFDPAHAARTDRGVPAHGWSDAEPPLGGPHLGGPHLGGPHPRGHVAFAVSSSELDAWRDHLARLNVPIDMEVNWDAGGTSIYLRDPAGNSVELAPPTLWGGEWDF